MKKTIPAVAALVAMAGPAAADAPGVPGTVSGSDRTLTAACHYTRTTDAMDADRFELTGVATAAPDATVFLRCTVTSSWGGGTAYGSGFNHAVAQESGFLGRGQTTVCVEASAYLTIDVQMHVDRCQTYPA